VSDSRYIDFISAYCDRWCERCAFTERCSLFAVECAMAMCDDEAEAMELAVGRAPSEDGESSETDVSSWIEELNAIPPPTAAEMAEVDRKSGEQHARLDATSIMQTARAYTVLAARWLRAESASLKQRAEADIRDALEIVEWDHFLITMKLRRALHGFDEVARGTELDDEFARADANSTAKLALLCIERSETAWRAIAQWSDNEFAAVFAEQLAQLQREVEQEFPHARGTIRPGLDELV
jgi:hypothetical protein